MKKIVLFVCASIVSMSAVAAGFNHSGVQKGSITESCYREPCSVSKVLAFKQLSKSANSSMIELTLLGGERPTFRSKTVKWNKKSHKVYVTCSIQAPTVTLNGQVTTLPINREMTVPGVLYSDTELYLKACHNFSGDATKAARRFGYDVTDW